MVLSNRNQIQQERNVWELVFGKAGVGRRRIRVEALGTHVGRG